MRSGPPFWLILAMIAVALTVIAFTMSWGMWIALGALLAGVLRLFGDAWAHGEPPDVLRRDRGPSFRDTDRLLRALSEARSLTFRAAWGSSREGNQLGSRLTGTLRGADVRVVVEPSDESPSGLRTRVLVRPAHNPNFDVDVVSIDDPDASTSRATITGDEAFDEHLAVVADGDLGIRRLDAATRGLLVSRLEPWGAELRDGELRVDHDGPPTDELERMLDELTRTAKQLTRAWADAPPTLIDRLVSEPSPGARLRLLRAVDPARLDDAERSALRALAVPPLVALRRGQDRRVIVRAAALLRDVDTLDACIRIPDLPNEPSTADLARADALVWLTEQDRRRAVAAAADAIDASPGPALGAGIVDALADEPALVTAAIVACERDVDEAAVRALVRQPIDEARPALHAALTHADPDLAERAIDRLALRGDRRDVPALRRAATDRSHSRRVRRAARAALDALTSDATEALAGAVAVVNEHAVGAVAVVDAPER